MESSEYDIGMIGLGTMGRNLVLNIGDKGFSAVGYDRDMAKVDLLRSQTENRKIRSVNSIDELLKLLKKPRIIMMLVPAGAPVDAVIADIIPFLEKGDIIIDGGNSHFTDTDRRTTDLLKKDIFFLGTGVSGGEKGARFGPSIMPGGPEDGYNNVKTIFEAIAAKADGQPCVAYLGPGSAGHYVKMVHNGIEYAVIQLIAESYHLLKQGLGLNEDQLHQVYRNWNQQLQSFLFEITSEIFLKNDENSDKRLINLIKDSAKQKGTGKWTSQDAMELQVPVPTIDAAVIMRDLSADKEFRQAIAQKTNASSDNMLNSPGKLNTDKDLFIDKLGNALLFAMITAYAQGLELLKAASDTYKYQLHLDTVASIWRSGCIIRAGILKDIYTAFNNNNNLRNLLLDESFAGILNEKQNDLREIIKSAIDIKIPVPALSASLSYFDAYRSNWLPANLVQAQRDYFGSHTYERIDKQGIFHTEWGK